MVPAATASGRRIQRMSTDLSTTDADPALGEEPHPRCAWTRRCPKPRSLREGSERLAS